MNFLFNLNFFFFCSEPLHKPGPKDRAAIPWFRISARAYPSVPNTIRCHGEVYWGSNTGNSSRANQRKDSVARVKLAVLTPCRARVSSALLIQSASPATKIRCSLSPDLTVQGDNDRQYFPFGRARMIQTLQSIFCIQPVHLPTDGIPHTGNRCYPEALFLYFQTCTTR